jgi:putative hydroxymethylpyrimidine transporter CytX
MEERGTSVFSNGLIWFGAAVSIAEILTGTCIAPLGFVKGSIAIIVGHVIGCLLLFLAGLIGARTRKSSMETSKIVFGKKGSLLFSLCNVIQLVGWTAIMVLTGATAANAIVDLGGQWVWCLIIGALIGIWVLIGVKNLEKLNIVVVGALFILVIILCGVVFSGGVASSDDGTMSFGSAVELAVAMSLSWLPLLSDYTRIAKRPFAATLASAGTYFVVSCWMFIIGLGAALFTGQSDIATIMLSAGLGVAGLLIVVFSTVTTTFLDTHSAGVSCVSINARIREKSAALIVCVLGVLLALFTPITSFEDFLYLIGSVFAPMAAILIVDYFVLGKDSSNTSFNVRNLCLWAVGFAIYRVFMYLDTPLGYTFPALLIVCALCLAVEGIARRLPGSKSTEPIQ